MPDKYPPDEDSGSGDVSGVSGPDGDPGPDGGSGDSPGRRSGLLLPFRWDTQKLHALKLPVRSLPMEELRWHLSWKVWANYGNPFQVSPSDVRHDPRRFSLHYERTMAADLSYPLHVICWEGRWTILDGIHRLLKADIIGDAEVLVYVVEAGQVEDVMVSGQTSSERARPGA